MFQGRVRSARIGGAPITPSLLTPIMPLSCWDDLCIRVHFLRPDCVQVAASRDVVCTSFLPGCLIAKQRCGAAAGGFGRRADARATLGFRVCQPKGVRLTNPNRSCYTFLVGDSGASFGVSSARKTREPCP